MAESFALAATPRRCWSGHLPERKRVFFFPDQHLGRNTALKMGITNEQMPVWNPHATDLGGNTEACHSRSRVMLWQGTLQRPSDVYGGPRASVSREAFQA